MTLTIRNKDGEGIDVSTIFENVFMIGNRTSDNSVVALIDSDSEDAPKIIIPAGTKFEVEA